MLDSAKCAEYDINYTPSSDTLRRLDAAVKSVCNGMEIPITYTFEKGWVVTYGFITSGSFSYIDFNFNSKGCITACTLSSENGDDDSELKQIIQKIKEYAV